MPIDSVVSRVIERDPESLNPDAIFENLQGSRIFMGITKPIGIMILYSESRIVDAKIPFP